MSFGMWAEAFESHLRRLPPDEVRSLCGGFVEDLGALLRSAAAIAGGVAGEPPRVRLLESLAVLLGNIAEAGPVIVFLDDAHLADASSWDALHYCARNLGSSPVLVVVAARTAELSGQLEHTRGLHPPPPEHTEVLFGLEQDGHLTRLELLPLPHDAVTELATAALGTPPPPTLVAWLEERARGNPLFTLSLLQALLDENADLAAPRLQRLPEGLTERVAARLGILADPARETLDLLAVVGRRMPFAELIALTGRPEEELGPILDGLARSPLITQDERGGELSYEIAHPIVQEAIYQTLGATRRRAVHRRVGRSLLADGRLGEAAPHIARSAEPGDSDAIDALCRAVRQAEDRHAYREALIILGSLAEVLPADDDRWMGVLDGLVLDADWIFDHRADVYGSVAVPALRAIDGMLGPSFDTARRAALKFRLGTFLIWGTGQLEEAERVNTEARRLFEAAGDRSAALLARLEEASIHFARGNLAAWVSIGRAVADEAEATGEPVVAMHAIGRGIGWGSVAHGAFDEADGAFRRAVTLARENGKPYFQSLSQLGLAYSLGLQGRIDEIEPLLHEAKALNRSWQEGSILEFEAVLRWVAGDFESTLRCARESMVWNASGKSRRRGFAMAFAAMAATETRRPAEAERFLAVAQAAYGNRPWASYTDLVRAARAVCDWRVRRSRRSVNALEEAATRLLGMEALPWAAFTLCDLGEIGAESRSKAVTAKARGRARRRGPSARSRPLPGTRRSGPRRRRVGLLALRGGSRRRHRGARTHPGGVPGVLGPSPRGPRTRPGTPRSGVGPRRHQSRRGAVRRLRRDRSSRPGPRPPPPVGRSRQACRRPPRGAGSDHPRARRRPARGAGPDRP